MKPAFDEWVYLKVNMILYGSFVRIGTWVKLEDIPIQLRRNNYIGKLESKIASGYFETLDLVRKLSEGKCHFIRNRREIIPSKKQVQNNNKFSRILDIQKFFEKNSRWKVYRLIETFRGKEEWFTLKIIFLSCKWYIPDLEGEMGIRQNEGLERLLEQLRKLEV